MWAEEKKRYEMNGMTFAGACECNSADQYPHLSHFCGHLTMNKRLLLYTLPLHHMEHRTHILCETAEKKPEYQFGKYRLWSAWTGSSGTTLCSSWSELSSLVSLFSNSGGRTRPQQRSSVHWWIKALLRNTRTAWPSLLQPEDAAQFASAGTKGVGWSFLFAKY